MLPGVDPMPSSGEIDPAQGCIEAEIWSKPSTSMPSTSTSTSIFISVNIFMSAFLKIFFHSACWRKFGHRER
jgi:hypothetical protein